MAIYEYECIECRKQWEEARSVDNRDAAIICPDCACYDCKRLISRSSFHLKGGGWEKDGYSDYVGDALNLPKHKKYT